MRLWIALLLPLLGCREAVVITPPLDVRLGPSQVRAGRITHQSELIGGPTARGRAGDYKIYNDRIAVIIAAADHPLDFSPYGGTVADADIIRDAAGQSAFGEIVPAFELAVLRVERVEVIDDGDSGTARIRVSGRSGQLPLFDAVLGSIVPEPPTDLEWRVDYVLEAGAQSLRVEHELFNAGSRELELGPVLGFFFGTGAEPILPGAGFRGASTGASAPYYGAASSDVTYLYLREQQSIGIIFGESGLSVAGAGDALRLRARERMTIVEHLVVTGGNVSEAQSVLRKLTGDAEVTIEGRVLSASGQGVGGARVHVTTGERWVTRAVADESGAYRAFVPPGSLTLLAAAGEGMASAPVTVDAAESMTLDLTLPSTGRIEYVVKDGNGADLPVKIGVVPLERAATHLPRRFGEREHMAGQVHTELAHTGRGAIELLPGRYRVHVSRGGEYEVETRILQVEAGASQALDVTLVRAIASAGWLTAEPHVHALRSPDSSDSFELKVRAMVVENIELPISTDHEAVGDFGPAIAALGVERFMKGIVGTEITTTRYGHFNAFPVLADVNRPGRGRIDWYGLDPADMFAAVRARPEAPFLQVNHPRSTTIGYFHLLGFDRDSFAGKPTFSFDFDGIEVVNGCEDAQLSSSTVLDWFAFLDRGIRMSATGTMDDHNGGRGQMGYPITYVRLNTDNPNQVTQENLRAAFLAGHLGVSCGPFVELTVGDAGVGDLVGATGAIEARVRVEAPSWMDVDTLTLVVGGQVRARVDLGTARSGLRFDDVVTATLTPGRDTWLVAWVEGDTPHGAWADGRRSVAFTNALWVDGDGDGLWHER